MPRTAAKRRALTEIERRQRGRRLRLIWASGGDREQAASVERMIETGRLLRGPRPYVDAGLDLSYLFQLR
jgi:hypothetical protein